MNNESNGVKLIKNQPPSLDDRVSNLETSVGRIEDSLKNVLVEIQKQSTQESNDELKLKIARLDTVTKIGLGILTFLGLVGPIIASHFFK